LWMKEEMQNKKQAIKGPKNKRIKEVKMEA
jgi:hypothetical protein